jgi:uncharacterized protein (DUF924 family)
LRAGRCRRFPNRFEKLPQQALHGKLDTWLLKPASAVSPVLVLDQFPRNLLRGSSASFDFGEAARAAPTLSISRGFDEILHSIEAVFRYERFEHYTQYAERHRDVITRFGRFPPSKRDHGARVDERGERLSIRRVRRLLIASVARCFRARVELS